MMVLSSAGEKNRILQDVSFEIKKGEKVAILTVPRGGKSTVMRIIAGIIKPEAGTVEVNGTPTLMFDYRLGFDGGLSGHDNYEMRASLMGWSKQKIKEKEEKVFRFAGLGDMIDDPVRSYPKGGAMRLGFAVITEDTPEFMLIDERLTFGNTWINKKYLKRLTRFASDPEITLVIAATDLKITKKLCERGIVISEGKVVFDGPCSEAAAYLKEIYLTSKGKKADEEDESQAESEMEPESEDDGMDEMQ